MFVDMPRLFWGENLPESIGSCTHNYAIESVCFTMSSLLLENIHPAPQLNLPLKQPPNSLSLSFIGLVSPIMANAFSE